MAGKKKKNKTLLAGILMLALLGLASLLAPLLAPADPLAQDLYSFLQPPGSPGHPLGTDQLGRDILSRLLHAGRTDLMLMAAAEVLPFCLGNLLGMAAGYFGGWADWLVTLLTDVFIAFPYYLLVIIVAFLTGAGPRGIFLTFLLVGWLLYARVAKGVAASLRNSEWVQSVRVMGFSHCRILLTQILPNVLPQTVVVLMTDMAGLLVMIVTLGYLGIGIAPPAPDWGTMIAEGQNLMTTAWWLSVLPGLMVVYTGISLSLIGDGLADRWRQDGF